MYSLTSQASPYVHMGCGCSRTFIIDELYYCVKCAKPLCRFCLSEEIDSFFCSACSKPYSIQEASNFKNKCIKYLSCPICFSSMSMQFSAPNKKR